MEFTKLERAVIQQIMTSPIEGMEGLRRQFTASSVVKREYTGVGFYTTISVPESVPPVQESVDLRDQLMAGASGLVDTHVCISFHLWMRQGYLRCLEGKTNQTSWPDEEEIEVVASGLVKVHRIPGTSLSSALASRFRGLFRRRDYWSAGAELGIAEVGAWLDVANRTRRHENKSAQIGEICG
jgi:hypothetical protein